jgi:hypothetical protein
MAFAPDFVRSVLQRAPYDFGKFIFASAWSAVVVGVLWERGHFGMTPLAMWLWIGLLTIVVFACAALLLAYLRYQKRIVVHLALWTHKDAKDVKAFLENRIASGLETIAERNELGDPFKGSEKKLVVVFSRGDGLPTVTVFNEHDSVRLT